MLTKRKSAFPYDQEEFLYIDNEGSYIYHEIFWNKYPNKHPLSIKRDN